MILRQFWRDLRSQKLRTAITILGIAWGTVAVVFLQGVGEAFESNIARTNHALGEGIGIIFGGRTSRPWQGMGKGRAIRLVESDVEYLRGRIPEIARISPEYRISRNVKFSGRPPITVQISGITPEWGNMRSNFPQAGGRFINDFDMNARRRVAFIGDELRKDLFGDCEAVGNYIEIQGVPFRVIGVQQVKRQNSSYGMRDEENAVIPASTFKSVFLTANPSNIIYQALDASMMPRVLDEVYRLLGERRRFDPDDRDAVFIWDTTENERFFRTFFLGFRMFMLIMATMTLMVGGIGVANILNAVVEERQREIGLKIAVGATPALIQRSFMAEAALLSAVGGLLGAGVTCVLFRLYPLFPLEDVLDQPAVSITTVAITMMILGGITLAAGWFPARRAARLQPMEALR